eukprot:GHVO01045746.1.p1 GENE.GHVO01045746.1~~GHVO01045746.1.p1  ORF type:complete len:404 (+),score=55.04 GHVO01045746.1:55-1212(+)
MEENQSRSSSVEDNLPPLKFFLNSDDSDEELTPENKLLKWAKSLKRSDILLADQEETPKPEAEDMRIAARAVSAGFDVPSLTGEHLAGTFRVQRYRHTGLFNAAALAHRDAVAATIALQDIVDEELADIEHELNQMESHFERAKNTLRRELRKKIESATHLGYQRADVVGLDVEPFFSIWKNYQHTGFNKTAGEAGHAFVRMYPSCAQLQWDGEGPLAELPPPLLPAPESKKVNPMHALPRPRKRWHRRGKSLPPSCIDCCGATESTVASDDEEVRVRRGSERLRMKIYDPPPSPKYCEKLLKKLEKEKLRGFRYEQEDWSSSSEEEESPEEDDARIVAIFRDALLEKGCIITPVVNISSMERSDVLTPVVNITKSQEPLDVRDG